MDGLPLGVSVYQTSKLTFSLSFLFPLATTKFVKSFQNLDDGEIACIWTSFIFLTLTFTFFLNKSYLRKLLEFPFLWFVFKESAPSIIIINVFHPCLPNDAQTIWLPFSLAGYILGYHWQCKSCKNQLASDRFKQNTDWQFTALLINILLQPLALDSYYHSQEVLDESSVLLGPSPSLQTVFQNTSECRQFSISQVFRTFDKKAASTKKLSMVWYIDFQTL